MAAPNPAPRSPAIAVEPAEPDERTERRPPNSRPRRTSPAVATAAAALVVLLPSDVMLGSRILVDQGPASVMSLLGVQIVTALGWTWIRTRRIPRPGWGHVVLTVLTALTAVAASALLYRDYSSSTIPSAAAVTVAIMIAVGALLPARPAGDRTAAGGCRRSVRTAQSRGERTD